MMRKKTYWRKEKMKRILSWPLLFVFFIIMFIIVPVGAFAASIGNPKTLGELGKVAIGLEYDNSNADLTLKNASLSNDIFTESFGANNMRLTAKTTYVVGTIGVFPNVDIFAGVGMNKAKLEFATEYAHDVPDDIEIKDNSNVAYKVGARARIAEVVGVTIGAMGQYSAYAMDGHYLVNGQEIGNMYNGPAEQSTNMKISEWQAALTASKTIGRFSPYAGVTCSRISLKHDTTFHVIPSEGMSYDLSFKTEAKQENNLGAVIGAGVRVWNNFDINAEVRTGNQDAFTAAVNYRF